MDTPLGDLPDHGPAPEEEAIKSFVEGLTEFDFGIPGIRVVRIEVIDLRSERNLSVAAYVQSQVAGDGAVDLVMKNLQALMVERFGPPWSLWCTADDLLDREGVDDGD